MGHDVLHQMSMWIASLWVFEAERWNLPLWENMILMGNNGRYLTALIFPFVLLLHRTVGQNSWSIGKPLLLALLVVLPLSLSPRWIARSNDVDGRCGSILQRRD